MNKLLFPALCALMWFSTVVHAVPPSQVEGVPDAREVSRSRSAIQLAQDGKALQPIIISAAASERTKTAAAELAKYLGQISGATFEIKTGAGTSGIVLGTLEQFPQPELQQSLKIHNGYDGVEAFAIRTEKDRVLLIGRTDKGTSHAAYRMLELLGVRWFFPPKEWHVVPQQSTLSFGWNETDRPEILARRIWYGYGKVDDRGAFSHQRGVEIYRDWLRRNRMDQSFFVDNGHVWGRIYEERRAQFDEHPEYLALVDGKRRPPHFCVTDDGLQKLVTDWALSYLEKNPGAAMVSMEPSDGAPLCETPACVALAQAKDAPQNQAYHLANVVARAVAEKYPGQGKMVGLVAYDKHSQPPTFPLEPNVYVQLTAGLNRGDMTYEELVEAWQKRTNNMGYYEYFSVWPWDNSLIPGGKAGNLEKLAKQIRAHAARPATTSIDAESSDSWGPHGRGYYVANKLMWNPQVDISALLDDFYQKAFGPAALAMRRYYERTAGENEALLSTHLLGAAFRDLKEAMQLAKNEPQVLDRVEQLVWYLEYNRQRLEFNSLRRGGEGAQARRKELALSMLTLGYRTRYGEMMHWPAMMADWTRTLAKEFNEPTWSYYWEFKDENAKENKPAPWRVDKPVTRQETMEVLNRAIAALPTEEIPVRNFSYDDLVPVQFEDPKPRETYTFLNQWARYAFYSMNGEALEMEVLTGADPGGRDRYPSPYMLEDANGKVLQKGKLPLDGEWHKLRLEVPKAGLYYFDFNGSGVGWKMRVKPGVRLTLLLDPNYNYGTWEGMAERYFYVPKGTKTISYYWKGSPDAHRVFDPSGALALETQVYGEYVMIPVPAGMDGKLWKFGSELPFFQVGFSNIPNLLAASPSSMLLPRELAEKDGLTIVR